jgi:hypothetical protein
MLPLRPLVYIFTFCLVPLGRDFVLVTSRVGGSMGVYIIECVSALKRIHYVFAY